MRTRRSVSSPAPLSRTRVVTTCRFLAAEVERLENIPTKSTTWRVVSGLLYPLPYSNVQLSREMFIKLEIVTRQEKTRSFSIEEVTLLL